MTRYFVITSDNVVIRYFVITPDNGVCDNSGGWGVSTKSCGGGQGDVWITWMRGQKRSNHSTGTNYIFITGHVKKIHKSR